MVEIFEEKCIGCGLCVQDCPMKNLSVADGKAKVRGNCMECGHCFAICPSGAVQITDCPSDGVIELKQESLPVDGDSLLELIKSRRSIRNFQAKEISREKWSKVLEAGRFTASAANNQDVKYIVIQEELETVKKYVWDGFYMILENMRKAQGENNPFVKQLEGMIRMHENNAAHDPLFFNTPALLVITSSSMLNGGLATSNIELMAHTEGLGVLISGFIQMALSGNEAACKYLNVDAKQICSCLLVGYPAVKYQRSVQRKAVTVEWK